MENTWDGPARAAHEYFRVDEYDLNNIIQKGDNIVFVEVAGYNVNSYYTLDQPSFLQAEVQSNSSIVLATGSNPGFEAFQLKERLQKVERYSFQRSFTEYYRLKNDYDNWKKSGNLPAESLKIGKLNPVNLLPRHLLKPEFNIVHPVSFYSQGNIQLCKPKEYKKDRSLTRIDEKHKGYPENEFGTYPFINPSGNKNHHKRHCSEALRRQ